MPTQDSGNRQLFGETSHDWDSVSHHLQPDLVIPHIAHSTADDPTELVMVTLFQFESQLLPDLGVE